MPRLQTPEGIFPILPANKTVLARIEAFADKDVAVIGRWSSTGSGKVFSVSNFDSIHTSTCGL